MTQYPPSSHNLFSMAGSLRDCEPNHNPLSSQLNLCVRWILFGILITSFWTGIIQSSALVACLGLFDDFTVLHQLSTNAQLDPPHQREQKPSSSTLTDLYSWRKWIERCRTFFHHTFLVYFNVMIHFKATNIQSSAGCLGQAREDKWQFLIRVWILEPPSWAREREYARTLIIRLVMQLLTLMSVKAQMKIHFTAKEFRSAMDSI